MIDKHFILLNAKKKQLKKH